MIQSFFTHALFSLMFSLSTSCTCMFKVIVNFDNTCWLCDMVQQCTWKTFMIHQTFVRWAFNILFKFVKSPIRHLGLAIGNVRCIRWFSWTLVQIPVMTTWNYQYSFIYTSGHCRRWRSRMEVKIMAGSLFVHCKIAYFYSVTAEKWLIVSLPNFVTIRTTHFSISCKIFSWIRSTKLKIHAMEFCDFIKDSVSPSGLFVPCSLTATSTWRPRLTAHCPIGERH